MKLAPRFLLPLLFLPAAAGGYIAISSLSSVVDAPSKSITKAPGIIRADTLQTDSSPLIAPLSVPQPNIASVPTHSANVIAPTAALPSFVPHAFDTVTLEARPMIRRSIPAPLPPLIPRGEFAAIGVREVPARSETASAPLPTTKSARGQSSSAIQEPAVPASSAPLSPIPAPEVAAAGNSNVIYFGLQNIAIPVTLDGVYLNVDNGATAFAEFTGWDINPFFGGTNVGNSPSFQPARTGIANDDPIVALGAGAAVDGTLFYSSGYGGSEAHMGPGGNQFQPGQEAYLGFRFTTDANGGPHYGWMRVVFSNTGGTIKDWAYDTGTTAGNPTAIQTGNILQAAPASGVSVVTVTGTGQSTLGSALTDAGGGIVTALTKNGAGSWTMSGDKTYTGATTVNAGILEVGANGGKLSGTAAITVNGSGTLLLGGTGGTNVKLNNAAAVTLAGGKIDLGNMTSSLNQTVGALTLTATSILDLGLLVAGNTWKFAASNADWSSVQLAIHNYTGGADHLFFGSDTSGLNASQLDRILFYSDGGSNLLGSAQWLSGGEVIPVPEPTAVLAAAAVTLLLLWRERRRILRKPLSLARHRPSLTR